MTPTPAAAPFVAAWLGRRRYHPTHELQRRLVARRVAGEGHDLLLLLEHEPVVTLGRGAPAGDVRPSPPELARLHVDLAETGRGGNGTFHGPGQLVGYPLLDLKPDRCDVRKYVRSLASIMERLAADVGLAAGFLPGAHLGTWVDRASPGVWPGEDHLVEPAKIGAIGVRLSRWVTMHGFAFNGSTDLDEFRSLVVPCGITDRGITSIADLLGSSPAVVDLARRAARHASGVWGAGLASFVDLAHLADDALDEALASTKS